MDFLFDTGQPAVRIIYKNAFVFRKNCPCRQKKKDKLSHLKKKALPLKVKNTL